MMNRMASVYALFCAASLAFTSSAETITASDTVLARLQSTTTPDGGDWTAWGTTTMLPPQLVTNAPALGGGAYLDFKGNRYALSFNPAYLHESDEAMTNALDNIGTVIAVWGSDVRNGGVYALKEAGASK